MSIKFEENITLVVGSFSDNKKLKNFVLRKIPRI